jgi:hypothetical protein
MTSPVGGTSPGFRRLQGIGRSRVSGERNSSDRSGQTRGAADRSVEIDDARPKGRSGCSCDTAKKTSVQVVPIKIAFCNIDHPLGDPLQFLHEPEAISWKLPLWHKHVN